MNRFEKEKKTIFIYTKNRSLQFWIRNSACFLYDIIKHTSRNKLLRPEATLIRDAPADLRGMQGLTPSEQVQTTFATLFSLSPAAEFPNVLIAAAPVQVQCHSGRKDIELTASCGHTTDINRNFMTGVSCSLAVLPIPIKKTGPIKNQIARFIDKHMYNLDNFIESHFYC